jgi:hypothetical protein
LAEVLDAIMMAAERPIKYAVDSDCIAFSLKEENAHLPLFSRTFKLDWNTLAASLGVTLQTNSSAALEGVAAALRGRLAEAGWSPDAAKGETMFMSLGKGLLYARTTVANLDWIETVIQTLQVVAEPDTGSARPASASSGPNQAWLAPTMNPGILRSLAATNNPAPGQFRSRTFKLDVRSLQENLPALTGRPLTNLSSELRQLFPVAGWEPGPGETFFLNQHTGGLFVARRAGTGRPTRRSF